MAPILCQNVTGYQESVPVDEIAFDAGVVLLKKAKAEELKKKPGVKPVGMTPLDDSGSTTLPPVGTRTGVQPPVIAPPAGPTSKTLRLSGNVPPELWNRLGTRVLPKLRSGKDLKIGIEFSVVVDAASAHDLQTELKQILADLGLQASVEIE